MSDMTAVCSLPTHLFLYQHLDHAARCWPDRPAIRDGRRALTYAGLQAEALGAAQRLADAGTRPGDRVILLLGNSVDFAVAYWGAVHAGAVVTPISPETPVEKLGWIIADCTPRVVVAEPGPSDQAVLAMPHDSTAVFLTPADLAVRTSLVSPPCAGRLIDQDLGCMIYTSGSTGTPKGVMLSHQNLTAAARSVCTYLGYRGEDRIFVTVPLTFDYGMHQLTMAALVGAEVIVERSFGNALFTLDRMVKAGTTVLPIVPTMVRLIAPLADRFDLSGIRLVSSTAAALHPGMIDRLGDMFPGATVFSMYGLTECHRCTYLPPEQLQRRKGSVGIAIPNTELWVELADGTRSTRDATGELVIRGATVMKGYWNNPEKTAQRLRPGRFPGEMVLYTGDLCRLDAEGFLYFLARSDDVLKIRGEKVAPKEVEDALQSHPAVSEAVVFGRPDPVQGHVVCAVVTFEPGRRAEMHELKAWCASRLEPVAVPQRIELRERLARNVNGKIDRAALLQDLV
jgi:amino acid adenylation domain-containing protein